MKLRDCTVVISLTLGVSVACAFQPLEAGLEPLYRRLTELRLEMQPLDRLLKATETLPFARAVAYRRYVLLENESRRMRKDIEQVEEWLSSPLVNLLGSAHQVPPTDGLTAPSSGQPSAAAHVER